MTKLVMLSGVPSEAPRGLSRGTETKHRGKNISAMIVLVREYSTYMLRCRDGSYYTGVTNSLEERLVQHQEGMDSECYTFKRRPVTLVCSENFKNIEDAIAAEKQIKGWSRKKEEALIVGNFSLLHELAMSREKREKIGGR